eukprot:m.880479 g.880479  ORF g.880479 m.880479 type:complete len:68 (-) comp23591_c2_seq1:2423-2626(-)
MCRCLTSLYRCGSRGGTQFTSTTTQNALSPLAQPRDGTGICPQAPVFSAMQDGEYYTGSTTFLYILH